jgi:hypothetical protein
LTAPLLYLSLASSSLPSFSRRADSPPQAPKRARCPRSLEEVAKWLERSEGEKGP